MTPWDPPQGWFWGVLSTFRFDLLTDQLRGPARTPPSQGPIWPVWTGLDRPGSGLARPMPASDDILGLHMPYWVILVTQDEPGRPSDRSGPSLDGSGSGLAGRCLLLMIY